ncbi:hypothetical protein WQ53_06295 [Pseudoxanthomonas suwonensis]|uniref:Secreted protein n=2 Tax=Pseudoxanthomonas suwonensis TaxID=314722 RepID=A0A0E3UMW8_9GAMM|nr:hypothetical protein WQ53_06295 [Pseudoxanthomonas suwonensis]
MLVALVALAAAALGMHAQSVEACELEPGQSREDSRSLGQGENGPTALDAAVNRRIRKANLSLREAAHVRGEAGKPSGAGQRREEGGLDPLAGVVNDIARSKTARLRTSTVYRGECARSATGAAGTGETCGRP